ncbi:MAG: hypothetical protein LBO66_05975 [Deltaproteobacteria bacterium]|nr:hypothetical protein [Deltaproteobacteria bacterium]
MDRINLGLWNSNVPEISALAFKFDDKPYMSRPSISVQALLKDICRSLDKELVVFFDEADCLGGDPLIKFLSQIRDGYIERVGSVDKTFPRTLALVGMRDIRDYKYKVRSEERSTGSGIPFNIIKQTLTLPDFTEDEIRILYGQHTEATGQAFETNAIKRAWRWTEGQPWLVNALADNIITKRFRYDYSRTVKGDDIDQSAQDLILQNSPHFDSLAERLREPRVRRVIEPVIIGVRNLPANVSIDDVGYVKDLGLLKGNPSVFESLRASNPLYGELIVRALTNRLQDKVPVKLANKWMDGTRLDMDGLLRAFQFYWRVNADINEKAITKAGVPQSQAREKIERVLSIPDLAQKYNVREEIAEVITENLTGFATEDIPHNVLNAFPRRVVNGGASIQRELAVSGKRADIRVIYKDIPYLLELKIKGAMSVAKSVEQLFGYMDACEAPVGWLLVFDMDFKKLWSEKQFWETKIYKGKTVHVVGC